MTPGATVGVRAALGAAAQASAMNAPRMTERRSIGREWYSRKLRISTFAVRPLSYGKSSMQQGAWTIKACASDDVQALARALEVAELTASVLVRRGYTDPDEAATFLAAEAPHHDPFLL